MTEPIKIMIVDDHAIVRAGLKQILSSEADMQIAGEAVNGLEAIDTAFKLQPDIILMDVNMAGCSGLDALLAIKDKSPSIKVLMLTVSESEDDLFKAIKYGADGYLLKSASITEVAEAVRKTARGEAILSTSLVARLMAEFRDRTGTLVNLSVREKEVLQLIGEGLTNLEIASRLFIGESTVRTHLQRIVEKLHLKNRASAIAFANQQARKIRPD
jgi:DNA-binding NarL/FixJ family response regulator